MLPEGLIRAYFCVVFLSSSERLPAYLSPPTIKRFQREGKCLFSLWIWILRCSWRTSYPPFLVPLHCSGLSWDQLKYNCTEFLLPFLFYFVFIYLCIYLFTVLELKLKALSLFNRCSATWATPPSCPFSFYSCLYLRPASYKMCPGSHEPEIKAKLNFFFFQNVAGLLGNL
jgi:hypothetical protein